MRIFRFVFRISFKFVRKSKGVFVYSTSQDKDIFFNARNTQFHSIYLPYMKYYETEISTLIDILIKKNDVFYDIGSNWGHYSLFVASNTNFNGRIHAFEPHPETFKDLSNVVLQAGLESIIHCYNTALSDSNGDAFIYKPDNTHSGTATLLNAHKGIRITQHKLDDLKIENPTIIKMDVEEFEYYAFKGAEETIKKHKPYIIFENHKKIKNETFRPFEYLADLGYTFYYPMFFRLFNGHPVYNGQQNYPADENDYELGLWEFSIKERFFLPNLINIFACHKDMKEDLKKRILKPIN